MAFKKQGKDITSKIQVIQDTKMLKPNKNKKLVVATEQKIICPHCHKVIGTKIGQIYQVLDKRLISLKGTVCPKCNKDLIK